MQLISQSALGWILSLSSIIGITGVLLALSLAPNNKPLVRAERCPELPSGSDILWDHRAEVDFDICIATRNSNAVFGVYLGNWPNFHHDSDQRFEKGRIGRHGVQWYAMSSRDPQKPIGRETLVRVREAGGTQFAHLWFSANNPQEIQEVISVVSQIQLK